MNNNESSVSRRDVLQKGGVLTGGLVLGASAASNPALAKPERETKSATVAAGGPFTAVDENGTHVPFDDPETLLYEPLVSDDNDTRERLTAPDGHHITWGEWRQVSGRVEFKCLKEGTHVTVHTSDLIDKGVYTIWVIVLNKSGLVGGGPLGANDGSENAFRASESGEGHIVALHEPKKMPLPPGNDAEYGECLLTDHMTVLIVGGYHNDNQTHGTNPLPNEVDHFIAVF